MPTNVTCANCGKKQDDDGRLSTCMKCGFHPLPSFSYKKGTVFHPEYVPEKNKRSKPIALKRRKKKGRTS